jgi:nucleoside-diphosphate-sugar epimerase
LIADRSIQFVKGDVGDAALLHRLFDEHKFTRVAHIAAEPHVDRSLADPSFPADQRPRHVHIAEGNARRLALEDDA